jgi:hypothetical protein
LNLPVESSSAPIALIDRPWFQRLNLTVAVAATASLTYFIAQAAELGVSRSSIWLLGSSSCQFWGLYFMRRSTLVYSLFAYGAVAMMVTYIFRMTIGK